MADQFSLIAKVTQKGEKQGAKGPMAQVELEEADGRKFTWTSFSTNEVKDIELGKVYEFMVTRPENPKGGNNPFRNIEKVVGPAEMTARPQSPGGSGTGSREWNGITGEQQERFKAAERLGIDRHGAAGLVLRILEAGTICGINELEEMLPKVLAAAEIVETWYQRTPDGPVEKLPHANTRKAATNGHSADPLLDGSMRAGSITQPEAPNRLVTIGAFLNAARDRWGEVTSGEVCEALGVKAPKDITDYAAAWTKLVEVWVDRATVST